MQQFKQMHKNLRNDPSLVGKLTGLSTLVDKFNDFNRAKKSNHDPKYVFVPEDAPVWVHATADVSLALGAAGCITWKLTRCASAGCITWRLTRCASRTRSKSTSICISIPGRCTATCPTGFWRSHTETCARISQGRIHDPGSICSSGSPSSLTRLYVPTVFCLFVVYMYAHWVL
jgi:hypothetical protein